MELCATNTKLFPEITCKNRPEVYMFGQHYCKECYRKLVEIHEEMHKPINHNNDNNED